MKTADGFVELSRYMKELLDTASKAKKITSGKSVGSVDTKSIAESGKLIGAVHASIVRDYAPGEGNSRIMTRFFHEFNSLMLGIVYTSTLARDEKELTPKQFMIYTTALDELIEFAKKRA